MLGQSIKIIQGYKIAQDNNGRFQKLWHKSKNELSSNILFLAQLKNGPNESLQFFLKPNRYYKKRQKKTRIFFIQNNKNIA